MLLAETTLGAAPGICVSRNKKGSPLPTADTDDVVAQAIAMPAASVRIWRVMSMLLSEVVAEVSAARPLPTITSS